jgi:hypothetical protein
MSVGSHGRHGTVDIKLHGGPFPDSIRDYACGAVVDPVNFAAVAPVAQLDRALRFERSGRRFESVRARISISGWLARYQDEQVRRVVLSRFELQVRGYAGFTCRFICGRAHCGRRDL